MNQPARKPGEGGKPGESIPLDDPSIPVLTERLTLPPLDLDLDFRLPQPPAHTQERAPVTPETPKPQPIDNDATRIAPRLAPFVEEPAQAPVEPRTTVAPAFADENVAVPESHAAQPPDEAPTDIASRASTSLLVSNLDTILSSAAPTHRRPQQDDFDLTVTDGGGPAQRPDTELREMILLDLARRLPTEVDTIVRRHLERAIEEAIGRFAAEVRIALAGSLREIVDRAVKAELDRLKATRG